jgi:hypothetical protein
MKKTEIFFTIIALTAALTAVSYFLLSEKKDFTAVALEPWTALLQLWQAPTTARQCNDEVFDNLPQDQKTQETVYAGVASHQFDS